FSHSLFRGNDGSKKSATIAPYAVTLPRKGRKGGGGMREGARGKKRAREKTERRESTVPARGRAAGRRGRGRRTAGRRRSGSASAGGAGQRPCRGRPPAHWPAACRAWCRRRP